MALLHPAPTLFYSTSFRSCRHWGRKQFWTQGVPLNISSWYGIQYLNAWLAMRCSTPPCLDPIHFGAARRKTGLRRRWHIANIGSCFSLRFWEDGTQRKEKGKLLSYLVLSKKRVTNIMSYWGASGTLMERLSCPVKNCNGLGIRRMLIQISTGMIDPSFNTIKEVVILGFA